jgi:gamma-glutamyltranspeptidase/glutathione hydrolase
MRNTIHRILLNEAIVVLLLLNGQLFAQRYSEATNGMVVTSTPEAAEAGLRILEMGGNAIDAAVATAFALMVSDPAMCSLAGRSQILIWLKDNRKIGIDGATETPGSVRQPAKIGRGYKTVPVPGSPAALEEMIRHLGTLPMQTIMHPAINLAKEGIIINHEYERAFKRYGQHFRSDPGAVAHFLKGNGDFYKKGDRFYQPALARTLEKIAQSGTSILYIGEFAESITDDMKLNGGLIEKNDLMHYQTLPGEVLEGEYRGYRVLSRGDQCDGASVIEMLNLLEYYDLSTFSLTDSRYIALLAQINHIAYTDEYLPDWIQISSATAKRRYREISLNEPFPVTIRSKTEPEEGETNHLSVIDKEGNAVSITQSIGPYFGSKVVNPELGFFYAYSYDMNDDPIPFQREKTSQSPSIVLKGNRPFLVIGSAGSSRIPGSIVQTIINVIDHGMDLYDAVSYPRVFLLKDELRLEREIIPDSTMIKLEELGYVLKPYKERSGWFGRVHAIQVLNAQKRSIKGAADPRDYGAALGY